MFRATHFFPITCSTMDMSNDRSSIASIDRLDLKPEGPRGPPHRSSSLLSLASNLNVPCALAHEAWVPRASTTRLVATAPPVPILETLGLYPVSGWPSRLLRNWRGGIHLEIDSRPYGRCRNPRCPSPSLPLVPHHDPQIPRAKRSPRRRGQA